jgi:hypothetical protein
MFCFTIRQLLEVLLIWVAKALKNARLLFFILILILKGWERDVGERTEGEKGTKGIKERKMTEEVIPR